MEDLKVKGTAQGAANSGELSGVWGDSLEDVSKEMEGEERRVGHERERETGEKGQEVGSPGHLVCRGAGEVQPAWRGRRGDGGAREL